MSREKSWFGLRFYVHIQATRASTVHLRGLSPIGKRAAAALLTTGRQRQEQQQAEGVSVTTAQGMATKRSRVLLQPISAGDAAPDSVQKPVLFT